MGTGSVPNARVGIQARWTFPREVPAAPWGAAPLSRVRPGGFAACWIQPRPSCVTSCHSPCPQPRWPVEEVALPERGTVQAHTAAHGPGATAATAATATGIPRGSSVHPPVPLSPRSQLPPVPRRQPEPRLGHQDATAAVPGGRGPAWRGPGQPGERPERWQRSGESAVPRATRVSPPQIPLLRSAPSSGALLGGVGRGPPRVWGTKPIGVTPFPAAAAVPRPTDPQPRAQPGQLRPPEPRPRRLPLPQPGPSR